MLRRSWPIALLISIAAAGSVADHCGLFGQRGPDRQRYDRAIARVLRVVDGDTLDLDMPDHGATSTRVRLLGIDCPEIPHNPGESGGFHGREAAEYATNKFTGRRVRISLDPTQPVRDRHGRLLAYLFFTDGIDSSRAASLNQQLIEQGLAYADWRFDHVHELRFERAERLAMRAKIGMWKDLTREKMPPWRRNMLDRGERRR